MFLLTEVFVVAISHYFVISVTNKMSPRPSIVPEADPVSSPQSSTNISSTTGENNNQQQNTNVANQQQKQNQQNNNQTSGGKRTGSCRVCIKSFKPNEFSKTCFECQQRVCEDCASYSKLDPDEDAVSFLFVFLFLFNSVINVYFRLNGDVACVDGKWRLVSVYHKIRQIRCLMCLSWRHYNEDIPM